MAKLDFCYTFYDGDAAKDTQFLDRLQRGAYYDILSAQRRFGHLEESRIRQILAGDYEHCWPALQLLLSVDGSNKYFIVWLDESVTKSQKHATKQKENITKRYQTATNEVPKHYQNSTNLIPKEKTVLPLENEDEYEYKEEDNLGKGMQGENPLQASAEKPLLRKMQEIVVKVNANHIAGKTDLVELREIAEKLAAGDLDLNNGDMLDRIVQQFEMLYRYAMQDEFFCRFDLKTFCNKISSINQAKNSKNVKKSSNRLNAQQLPEGVDYASSFNRGR